MVEIIETTIDVSGQINDHNAAADAHADIRELAAQSDIFIATYGQTTLQEVDAAYKAKKAVFCYLEGLGLSPMVAYDNDEAIFLFVSTDTDRIVCTKLNDEWSPGMLSATPTSHAETHAAGGNDPITPGDIGAATVAAVQAAQTAANNAASAASAAQATADGKEASGTAASAVSAHNSDTTAHADIREMINGKADASHDQSASTISAGTFKGLVKALNLSVEMNGVRNITASTTDLTAGTSSLATGNIYLVYE